MAMNTGETEFHSEHYKSTTIEPIDFIIQNDLGFNKGSLVKYTYRAGNKEGQEKLDIHKIIDYALLLGYELGVDLKEDELISHIKYRIDWINKRK